MCNAGAVGSRERGGDLQSQIQGLADLNRSPLKSLAQRFALDELGCDKGTKLTLADFVDGNDVRVI
jgi:hypothetical protein